MSGTHARIFRLTTVIALAALGGILGFSKMAAAQEAPYGGTPWALPGSVQAENFDTGGESVGYYTQNNTNQGGQYRTSEGVSIETTSDTGGGYDVGWTTAGEWLNFTVNVATSGTYSIQARVACNGAGGTFHFNVDGVSATSELTVPNTGGWQTWTTISTNISLTAGQHVIQLSMDSAGGSGAVGNFNWFSVVSTEAPYGGTPWALPGTVQAENFDTGGENIGYYTQNNTNQGGQYRTSEGVSIEASSDTGGGYDVGWTTAGEWLNFTVNVATSGTYSIQTRVACNGAGGTFHFNVDGVSATSEVTVPNTGGWQTWTTVSTNINLTAGQHVVQLFMDSVGASGSVGNFNWFEVVSSEGPYGGTPWTLPGTVQAENFDTGGENVGYYTQNNTNQGGQYRTSEGVSIEATSDTGGGYDVGWTTAGEWLNYTVNVSAAGTYTMQARVASNGAGGTFHFNVDGATATSELTVPNTGGWQTWTTVSGTITLSAGQHVLQLFMDSVGSTGGVGNFNWVAVQSSSNGEGPYGGTPWTLPGTVQAENFDTGGENIGYYTQNNTNQGGQYRTSEGVSIETSSDTGGGYDVGWTTAGEWLNYTVDVSAAGTYTIAARVACNGAGGTFHFNVDGASATAELTTPNTGGWQTWTTVSTTITLSAGQHIIQLFMDSVGSSGSVGNFNWFSVSAPSNGAPNFGPNVLIFDPSMPSSTIQSQLDSVFNNQQSNQFGTSRYALLFKPGTYNNTVRVGFYTQVLGLGMSPDDVTINGAVQADAQWFNGNATQNFWRGAENLAVVPSGGTDMWAVSQSCPLRRVHIKGNLILDDNGGWSSGGFLADSVIDNQINSGTQQQWLSRNDQWGSWTGSSFNMVFVGDVNAPAQSFPSPAYTVVGQTPEVREKPFLVIDASGNYGVFVPALTSNTSGTSWSSGVAPGTTIPISQFYIAQASTDTAASINNALSQGLNLILTPGVYQLSEPINVTRANTVVLGLGIATLQPTNGNAAMTVSDVDGVILAGILFDAGANNSAVLLQVGPPGSSASHSSDPISLHDLFFRVGGAAAGQATESLEINSSDVIGDDFWIWRADHSYGVGWTTNPAANGLVVNGNNVTVYGLAVEHYQQYQTLWNGDNGRVYFYQSEEPYDVPDQSSWMNGSEDGYASYKVADTVTSHQAWGVGVYCYFSTNSSVVLQNAFEAPNVSGVQFHDLLTWSIGGTGTIANIINNTGGAANSTNNTAHLTQYP